MSENDLELLITLDDPEGAPEEDTFHHLQTSNFVYWLDRQFGASETHENRPQVKTS